MHIHGGAVFDWDANNLRKIRSYRIKADEVEKALSNDSIPIYEQNVEGEVRYVYYGETDPSRAHTIWMPGEEGLFRSALARGVKP